MGKNKLTFVKRLKNQIFIISLALCALIQHTNAPYERNVVDLLGDGVGFYVATGAGNRFDAAIVA